MTRGETMRKWREKRGLSQYELAKLSGVTQKTIWALETTKITALRTSRRQGNTSNG